MTFSKEREICHCFHLGDREHPKLSFLLLLLLISAIADASFLITFDAPAEGGTCRSSFSTKESGESACDESIFCFCLRLHHW